MPILKKWNSGDSILGIWKIEETVEELRSLLTDASCDDSVWLNYKSSSRQAEYLAARVLLKELCGMEHNIQHNLSGKPFLSDGSYNISISHTRGYVAVALNPKKEIGIDIEYFSDRVLKIESRFVRKDEIPNSRVDVNLEMCAEMCADSITDSIKNSITGPITNIRIYRLLLIWSGKETLFKVLNSSEVDFLEHLRIFPFEIVSGAGVMNAKEYRTPAQKDYTVNYILNSDFVLTYCVTDFISEE